MSKRKPLSPEAKAEAIARLNEVMSKFCEERAKTLTGVLAALRDEPREG
jgi:hypothetical protein